MRRAVVQTHGPTPGALLHELARFGVQEVFLEGAPQVGRWLTLPLGGGRPYPDGQVPCEAALTLPSPKGRRSDVETIGDPHEDRILVCEPGAVLDFNLARLLREAAPCFAVCDGTSTGIRLRYGADLRAARPIPVARFATRLPRPALFLDRDGTINVDHGYVGSRDRFEWVAGALDAIRLATEAGWHIFVVTNQSGIARGLFDASAVEALHAWMVDEVRLAGGNVDDIRFCPFHEAAADPRYRRASAWRKPAPGMILDLIARWGLDPAHCIVVGDQPSDVAAARAAGVAGYLFEGGNLADQVGRLLRSGVTAGP